MSLMGYWLRCYRHGNQLMNADPPCIFDSQKDFSIKCNYNSSSQSSDVRSMGEAEKEKRNWQQLVTNALFGCPSRSVLQNEPTASYNITTSRSRSALHAPPISDEDETCASIESLSSTVRHLTAGSAFNSRSPWQQQHHVTIHTSFLYKQFRLTL